MRRPTAACAFGVFSFVATLASATSAASKRKTDFPCPGCITELPDPSAPPKKVPLLVVLHGDGQGPLNVAHLFAKEAAARGMVLFVPKCPKADGCTDARWWAWDKDPAWFDPQIAAIDAVQPLDHDRLWLAGWSGGGSYIGRVAPSLAGRFAAVSVNGGGMSPDAPTCPTTCKLPVYFMVGDKNMYHSLAQDLRAWFDGCKQDVVWDLHKGKDHSGELVELSKPATAKAIVDWLEKHPKTCLAAKPEPEPEPVTVPVPASADATPTTTAAAQPITNGPASVQPPSATPGRCGCGIAHDRSPTALLATFALTAAAIARRRRRIRATRRG